MLEEVIQALWLVFAWFALFAPPASIVTMYFYLKRRIYQSVIKHLFECIDQHRDALVRRRFQLIREDDYGLIIDHKWRKEVERFCGNIVITRLAAGKRDCAVKHRRALEITIYQEVEKISQAKQSITKTSLASAPLDFERLCQEEFERQGFRARLTPPSGDHGADVIAEKGRLRIAIQCKKYTGTVGNKAVQEIVAAARHYRCGLGIVVATGDYTRGARQLASTNDVLLLHVSDLQRIDDVLDKQGRAIIEANR